MMKRWWERQWLRWAAVASWMGLIFLLSGQSRLPSLFERPDLQDVAGHLVVYAVLALLLRWALAGTGPGAGQRYASAWALMVVFLYGISDEFHQSFVPGRHPDPYDILTDVCGAGAALLALKLYAITHPATAASKSKPLE